MLRHISELDRNVELRKRAVETYAHAVKTISQYAVEVERPLAEKHRANLAALYQQIVDTTDPDALGETKSFLRAELRDYRDKSERELGKLREEFMSALMSLQEVMSSVAGTGSDHEKALAEELRNLQQTAENSPPDDLRKAVTGAVRNIRQQVDKMRSEMEVTLAQFRDEIRVLQRRLHEVEASTALDTQTGALNRKEFEGRIRRQILKSGSATVVFAKAKNYPEIERVYGSAIVGEVMSTMYKRLRTAVDEDTDVGRWSDLVFGAKFDSAMNEGVRASRELSTKLGGTYVLMQDGRPLRLNVAMITAIVEYRSSEDPDQFLTRVEQIIAAI